MFEIILFNVLPVIAFSLFLIYVACIIFRFFTLGDFAVPRILHFSVVEWINNPKMFLAFLFNFTAFAAWLTHVFVFLFGGDGSGGDGGGNIISIIAFPIGIFNGLTIWFGHPWLV